MTGDLYALRIAKPLCRAVKQTRKGEGDKHEKQTDTRIRKEMNGGPPVSCG
jgi:hypothetical protein